MSRPAPLRLSCFGAFRDVRPIGGCGLHSDRPSFRELRDLSLGPLGGSHRVRGLQRDLNAAGNVPAMSTSLPGADYLFGYKLVQAIIGPLRFSRGIAIFLLEQWIPFR